MDLLLLALLRAFRDLLRPGLLWHLLWPTLLALAIWCGIAWFAWTPVTSWLIQLIPDWAWLDWAREAMAVVGVLLIALPLIYLTAVLFMTTLALPLLMRRMVAQSYFDVAVMGGGTRALIGSLSNTLKASLLFLIGFAVTLPFAMIPGVIVFLIAYWTGWLNKRTYPYDALIEYATPLEMELLLARYRQPLLLAGMVCSALLWVPLVNLFAAAFTALVFIHFCLEALRRLRKEDGLWVSAQS